MSTSDFDLDRWVRVALLSVSGIGQQTFTKVLTSCEQLGWSLVEWWAQAARSDKALGLTSRQLVSLQTFQSQFSPESYQEYLAVKEVTTILDTDPTYPHLLKECDERPPLLFVKGSAEFWNIMPVGVVGTRKMTPYGETVTSILVAQLVDSGVTVISGGMYGVDWQAHQTALENQGRTVAVLGFGFDHWYPEPDKAHGQFLLDHTATLVTEFPPFMPPLAGNFPSRNRIVAGMSLGVVVIEAGLESGSHITATKAVEYNREVFAVPGPITNPYSQGTKWLINQGAKLVTSAADILVELGYQVVIPTRSLGAKNSHPRQTSPVSPSPHFTDVIEEKIYQEMVDLPTNIDDLQARLQLPINQLIAAVSQLEMNGFIRKLGDQWTAV